MHVVFAEPAVVAQVLVFELAPPRVFLREDVRLDVLEPLYGKALKLKSANPRLVKAARAATSAISDVAYELRGILNANVAFAVSVVGPRAVVLKDLGGKPSKSRSRIGRDVTEAPKAASIPGNDTESPTVGPAATKDVA